MRIVSWTPASPDQAGERLLAYVTKHDPEVVCLHRTDVFGDTFPLAALYDMGYYAKVHGSATDPGVGLLSPEPPREVRRDPEGPGAVPRVLSGSLASIRIVVGSGAADANEDHVASRIAPHERVLLVDPFQPVAKDFTQVAAGAPFAVRGSLAQRCTYLGVVDGHPVLDVGGMPSLAIPDRTAYDAP